MRRTVQEIRAAYEREWVLIVDCEFDESGRLVAGDVLVHSPHRSDIYARMAECRHKHCAVEYTGPFPRDYAALL